MIAIVIVIVMFYLFIIYLLSFWLRRVACGILVP